MKKYDDILSVIRNTDYLYPNYIFKQLKQEPTLEFISKIISKSGKEIGEALIVFLTAMKYINKSRDFFRKLELTNSFQTFLKENSSEILKLSVEKNVQANLPWRALPIIDILQRMQLKPPVFVLELGASLGLIGRCLLNYHSITENKTRYLVDNQQLPSSDAEVIDYYLGIELEIPEAEWLLAAVWEEEHEMFIRHFIEDFQGNKRFDLIKGNAFGFSNLRPVQEIIGSTGTVIILTSFMLYQYEKNQKELLIDEISNFSRKVNGHWINQAVNITKDTGANEFFISWDHKKLISLPDDNCLKWRWVSE